MATGSERAQLAVIGGGPGGYPAAFLAADLGMDVLLIDQEEHPGGVCLHRGCIPSKALLHAARVIRESAEAAEMGVAFGAPAVDVMRLRAWKASVVSRLVRGLSQLRDGRRIRHVRGRAVLTGRHSLAVREEGGGDRRVEFERAILATGSRPAALPGVKLGPPLAIDSTGALELADVPGRLLVVGGGYIGLELGTVYAALGSRVTVVEMLPALLPGADADLVRPLAARLRKRFESVRLETRVESLVEAGGRARAVLLGKDGARAEEDFDRVLVAIGRRPNTEGIGLDKAGVETDGRGFVRVDAQRRTSEPAIYAVGDVAGEPMLAHKATHEARVAVEAIAGRKSAAFAPRAIPAVVFTDPEIAWCGLTETQAAKDGAPHRVVRFPWSASGRALTLGRTEGVTKLLVHPESGRVLGVGLAGVGAGDLIGEAVVAMEMGATAEDLALSIHAHPTLSETIMEAGELFAGHTTHLPPAKGRGDADPR
jgi:dihydrolipoamide dehydrogenase